MFVKPIYGLRLRLRSVDGLPVTGAGQLQLWPIASNVSKLTPTWPENLFWTALYPVKPGKLGRGRAEDSAPGPNNSPIRNTVVATQLATPLSCTPQLALAHSSLPHSAPSRKLKGWTGS